MAIRTLTAEPEFRDAVPSKPQIGPDSLLAHEYCRGQGIELGAAAHNPFNLPNSINVSPHSDDPDDPEYEDFITYKKHQIEICGLYAAVDLAGEASKIPVPDSSQDYIISSHVVEHVPDLIGGFLEWNRALVRDGIIFMILPKRDAAELDKMRGITPRQHYVEDFAFERTPETHPFDGVEPRRRGHYHVFSLQSMLDLINWCNRHVGLNWEILETEETDSKVGNGHTVVARYRGPLQVRSVQLRVARAELARNQAQAGRSDSGLETTGRRSSAEAELAAIKRSLSWKGMEAWWRLGLRLLPPGSTRRRIYSGLTSRLFRLFQGRSGE